MSLFDYERSREIAARNYPFYALIMAAMRDADTENLEKLRAMFPDIYREFQARYNAPGGRLEGE